MDEEKMKEFNQVFGNIDVPKQADAPDVTPYDAVGNLNTALNNPNMNIESYLSQLSKINWMRTNPNWIGNAIEDGKISKKSSNVTLTYNKIKELIGL